MAMDDEEKERLFQRSLPAWPARATQADINRALRAVWEADAVGLERSSSAARSSDVGDLLTEIRRVRERVDDAERRFVAEIHDLEDRILASTLKIEATLSESNALADDLMQRVVSTFFYLRDSQEYSDAFDETVSLIRATLREVLFQADFAIALNEAGTRTSSWIERLWAKTKEVVTRPEVQEKVAKIERAIELQYIDHHQTQVDLGLSKAVRELTKALDGVDMGIISIGSLFVVKTKQKGQKKLGVMSLSQEQMKLVKQNPEMQVDPTFFLELISSKKKG